MSNPTEPNPIEPIRWQGDFANGYVEMLDQRLLPTEETYLQFKTAEAVGDGIREMVIRGAPAIGIAAAMGVALGARDLEAKSSDELKAGVAGICEMLSQTRPTAVNLFWALDRMKTVIDRELDRVGVSGMPQRLFDEAGVILAEDIAMNKEIGQHGAKLIPPGARILTHCNTGSLATGGYGTALGVIRACHERSETDDKPIHVWVDETRPYLQGARLTAWECVRERIPATLITDSMAGWFMQQGQVDAVVIGADRVAANGDVANKIGSYSLAVLAKHHRIPFYVAIPTSSLDLETPSGAGIEIEERSADEVSTIKGVRIAPEAVAVRHPAFDVTPAELVSGIITERGVARAPYVDSLAELVVG